MNTNMQLRVWIILLFVIAMGITTISALEEGHSHQFYEYHEAADAVDVSCPTDSKRVGRCTSLADIRVDLTPSKSQVLEKVRLCRDCLGCTICAKKMADFILTTCSRYLYECGTFKKPEYCGTCAKICGDYSHMKQLDFSEDFKKQLGSATARCNRAKNEGSNGTVSVGEGDDR